MAGLTRRRTLLAAGAAALAAPAAAGCGSGSGSGGGGAPPGIWSLNGGDEQTMGPFVAWWNRRHPDHRMAIQFFQNDPYKQKLRTAVGAGSGPVLFQNWGGGGLREYRDAGAVADLTPEVRRHPEWLRRFLPNVLGGATLGGRICGIPCNATQPVVLFRNNTVFDRVGAGPPRSWSELLGLVRRFRRAGVAPFTMGGASRWPDLMWLEYLLDRIGGPSAFDALAAADDPDAWRAPPVLEAAERIRELVAAGAFAEGFTSVSADTGQAEAQLYTGKAAMLLQGSWGYFSVAGGAPTFVSGGHLGWSAFPTVDGGRGDPRNVVGNPANLLSLSPRATPPQRAAALDYLRNGVMSDHYIDLQLGIGNVPPVVGIERKLQHRPHADWLQFVYRLAREAPHFQLSWDQALPPTFADALLTNLDRLFLADLAPRAFTAAMQNAAAAARENGAAR